MIKYSKMIEGISKYLEDKNEYIKQDYKFKYIFESPIVLIENKDLYNSKLKKMELLLKTPVTTITPYKMKNFLKPLFTKSWKNEQLQGVKLIHYGSISGFEEDGDIVLNKTIQTNDSKEVNSENFLIAFEKIVESIPKKTVIILNSEDHHMTKRKAEHLPSSAKKLKLKHAAEQPGQHAITDYFKIVRNATQKEVKIIPLKVEEIINAVRGADSQIKILWIPKGNIELNPCSYVSVIFCNEVIKYMEENPAVNLLTACERVIDVMPNDVWPMIFNYVQTLEDAYSEDHERKMNRENINDEAENERRLRHENIIEDESQSSDSE